MKQFFFRFFLTFGIIGLVVSCSTKKNSFKNRTYHKLTAHFNTLFNGQVAMDEALNGLKQSYQEDYSEILPVEPLPKFESKEFELTPEDLGINQNKSGNFLGRVTSGNLFNNENSDKTGFPKAEEKALKAIENHSMLIRGVERNNIIARAYLMLGQARYYQGKTFPALEALNYAKDNLPVTKHSPELDLFRGLANLQAGNKEIGEELLSELYYDEDDVLKKKMKAKVAIQTAQYLLSQDNLEGTLEALTVAEDLIKNKKKRARFNYIMGQILSRQGKLPEAAEKFTQAYDLKPGFDFEVKSQVAIAENFDPTRHDYQAFINHFESIAKKGNYISRKNELQYAMGLIALRADKLEKAQEYLDLSLEEKEISDQYIRSKTYSTYADLSFKRRNYVHTSAYYDSALAAMPYQKQKEILQEKNEQLKEVIEYYYLVQKNDSILKLAYLPKQDQEDFFQRYIDKLKIEDEKRREEEGEQLSEFQTESKISSFSNTFDNQSGKFYFYNQNAKSFGENEFKRIWGNIRLSDDWRISAKQATASEREAELLNQESEGNPRRYELAYYLEKIPTETVVLDSLKNQRDSTELKLGIGYFEVLSDKDLAIKTLEHLIETPPKIDEVKQRAYYNLYRIAEQSDDAKIEEYKNVILNQYPESVYANYILNPGEVLLNKSSPEALAFYEETYELFKQGENEKIEERYQEFLKKFDKDPLSPKFELLNAYAGGKMNGKDYFEKSLKSLTLSHPKSAEAEKAEELLAMLEQERAVNEQANKSSDSSENEEDTEDKQ